MKFIYNDGGRAQAGYQGKCGDCVVRSVAIAMEQPYSVIYEALAFANQTYRGKRAKGSKTARNGVWTRGVAFKRFMQAMGWKWIATMGIGTGCKVHLRESELPPGRLIVSVSKHYTAVIDGVIHDTHDPQRLAMEMTDDDKEDANGSRCVYGYWVKA